MMTPLGKQILRAVGAGLVTMLSHLAMYPDPPESSAQLAAWLWQPAIQGGIVAAAALGINQSTRGLWSARR